MRFTGKAAPVDCQLPMEDDNSLEFFLQTRPSAVDLDIRSCKADGKLSAKRRRKEFISAL
jgi:hypothetical protein